MVSAFILVQNVRKINWIETAAVSEGVSVTAVINFDVNMSGCITIMIQIEASLLM